MQKIAPQSGEIVYKEVCIIGASAYLPGAQLVRIKQLWIFVLCCTGDVAL